LLPASLAQIVDSRIPIALKMPREWMAFDAFPKTMDELKERTLGGAASTHATLRARAQRMSYEPATRCRHAAAAAPRRCSATLRTRPAPRSLHPGLMPDLDALRL
jgi:hypothetical protein